jgi:hypothetical protein
MKCLNIYTYGSAVSFARNHAALIHGPLFLLNNKYYACMITPNLVIPQFLLF